MHVRKYNVGGLARGMHKTQKVARRRGGMRARRYNAATHTSRAGMEPTKTRNAENKVQRPKRTRCKPRRRRPQRVWVTYSTRSARNACAVVYEPR